jgi:flagellar motor switch protein FliG
MDYDTLAETATRLAQRIDDSASVLERVAAMMDSDRRAQWQATRSRRLAMALRAAAEAFREHRIPPDDVRDIIRNP